MSANQMAILRRNFYISNYTESINLAKKIDKSDYNSCVEAQIFLYRCLLSKGSYDLVNKEISLHLDVNEFYILKLYCDYLTKSKDEIQIIEEIVEKSSNCLYLKNIGFIILGFIYLKQNKYDELFTVLNGKDDLECMSLYVLGLLALNQNEHALNKLETMKKLNEDSIITQITLIIVYLKTHYKIKEAHLMIKELCETVSENTLLLNLQAVYYLIRKKWKKSEIYLEKVAQLDPFDQNHLFNMSLLYQYKDSPRSTVENNFTTATSVDATHSYALHCLEKESQLNKLIVEKSSSCFIK